MVVQDDDVPLERLQAQIDVSMSFAHDLVTSWIKPTHLARLKSSSDNASGILQEELRRPPRLGVGAPIPTIPPLALEASKLKRKLGRNEAKNERAVESQPRDSPSNDEERKGRPAKRKKKADPFGLDNSKSRRKVESTISGALRKHSLLSRQEKQRIGPGEQSDAAEIQGSATLASSAPIASPVQAKFSPSLTDSPSLSEPSLETSDSVLGKPTVPESTQVHTDCMSIPHQAEPFGIPLLNLDGPPDLIDIPGNTDKSNKKKRKRRKKKKNQITASTG